MGLLYDVTYWHGNRRTTEFDSDVPAHALRAPKGHLAHCVCTNGERDDFWVDENGDVIPEPHWVKKDERKKSV